MECQCFLWQSKRPILKTRTIKGLRTTCRRSSAGKKTNSDHFLVSRDLTNQAWGCCFLNHAQHHKVQMVFGWELHLLLPTCRKKLGLVPTGHSRGLLCQGWCCVKHLSVTNIFNLFANWTSRGILASHEQPFLAVPHLWGSQSISIAELFQGRPAIILNCSFLSVR